MAIPCKGRAAVLRRADAWAAKVTRNANVLRIPRTMNIHDSERCFRDMV